MNQTLKQIGAFFLTVILASTLCTTLYFYDNKYQKTGLQTVDGLLVVENDLLDASPVNYLSNGWAFYPDVLLTPMDFEAGNPSQYMFYTTIGEKTHFNNFKNSGSPHGCGSYFMRMQLPAKNSIYALELPEIYSAYKIYVGNQLVLQMGNPEQNNYKSLTQNRMITFEASGSTNILISVSDYSHFYSGIVYPPAFGTPVGISTTRELRLGMALFIDTIALLVALLSLYWGLRMKHTNARLFSLLCIVMCFFTSYTLIHSAWSLPIFPWYTFEITSGVLFSLLLVILHNRMCDVSVYCKRISMAVTSLVFFITLCYGTFSNILTMPVIKAFSTLAFCFKLVLASYLLITAFVSLCKRKAKQIAPLFYASIFYATTFVWDRILPSYEPIIGGWFSEWGSLILVGAMGCTLWFDIISAYQNSILFSQEHRMMTRQLSMQTEYAKQLQKSNNENRRITHDFRHHLHTLKSLATQYGENNELLKYLEEHETITISQEYHKRFCNNVSINALLQYYSSIAVKHKIKTDFQIHLPIHLRISNVALCTVLGNLLENSVEACLQLDENNRFIKIFTNRVDNTFFLVVENSSDGNYKLDNGRFLSRKTNELRLGIGLDSVRHTIVQSGGYIDISPESTSFRVGIALKIK